MASIQLQELSKTYPNGHVALREVDLEVRDGELLVLVGPSGCGKSTLLRLIAGLESPTHGSVRIDGVDVTSRSPRERDVAMVFQSYALYPHKSVRENLAFGLRMRSRDRAEISRRVDDVARRLRIDEVLDRRPYQLSGGQRQRVALGRALVREPRAYLLDEPLSNLDARLRLETRAELARLHQALHATIVHVTHDQEEAMTLGTRVAVLNNGRVEQLGQPRELYDRPETVFVADFIGSPPMNWLDAQVERSADICRVRGEGFAFERGVDAPHGRRLRLGIRPEHLRLVEAGAGRLNARVEVVQPLGSSRIVHVALADTDSAARLAIQDLGERGAAPGSSVGLELAEARVHVFDAGSGKRLDPVTPSE